MFRIALGVLLVLTAVPEIDCSESRVAPPFDSGGLLMREQAAYDVTYYELSLSIDDSARTIDGSLLANAKVIHPISQFVLDLEPGLDVHRVEDSNGAPLRSTRDGGKLWIDLDRMYEKGESISAHVFYGGTPRVARNAPWDGGFTWATTPSGAPWIATTCQGEGADIWWPVKDHPSDEPDSMRMHITVREPLFVASNGRLENTTHHRGQRVTYDWFVSTPINTYNVALNIAPYVLVKEMHTSPTGERYPVEFYVLPEDLSKGKWLMREIHEHLTFYEELLGPYPFRIDKYGVAQTPHLGMEHQSIIAYGANFDNGAMTGGRDWGFDALHHHELSHEWWGNLVTNADWKDMWLHEGFGTYMQALYMEKLSGIEGYHGYMSSQRMGVRNELAIAPRESRTADQIYKADIYAKGASVLHTLRFLIGRDDMLTVLRRMAYPDSEMEKVTDGSQTRFVDTDDFIEIAEQYSGIELNWFFDVYVRQPSLPRMSHEVKDGKLEMKWEVPGGLPFPMPVEVRIDGVVQRVTMENGRASVELPEGVEWGIDPDNWILMDAD